MFALYSVATRAASGNDLTFTSLAYTAVAGAAAISLLGPFYWTPIAISDWPMVAALCVCGTVSHYCLIRAYDSLQASRGTAARLSAARGGVVIAVMFSGETLSRERAAWVRRLPSAGAGLFTMRSRASRANHEPVHSGIAERPPEAFLPIAAILAPGAGFRRMLRRRFAEGIICIIREPTASFWRSDALFLRGWSKRPG